MRVLRGSRLSYINPRFQCQLGYMAPAHAFVIAMCVFFLPMLMVAAEHAQLATTKHMNSMDQWCVHPHHTTFKCIPLMLSHLKNALPAMALQNEVVKSNIWCLSHSSYHANVRCVSSSPDLSISLGVKMMVVVGAVVALLLLMSGDIETNPGPVGNLLTLDDLGSVVKEVLGVSAEWYKLGLQLKVKPGILDSIWSDFTATKDQLQEMLKAWLITGDNPTWKALIDALRSKMVGASQLAAVLEAKFERSEGIFPPSPSFTKPTPSEIVTTTLSSLSLQCTQDPLCSPELKVFKLYFSRLVDSISHPGHLANQLYTQDVISINVRMTILGPCMASKLVATMEDQIKVNPSVFHKFLSVLRENPSLVYIADAMSDHYRSLLPPKCVNTSFPTLSLLSAELRDFENWYLLGLQLQISRDTLNSIEKAHDTRVGSCIAMIQHWISNSETMTWEAIHEALRNIGESGLAANIAGRYDICSNSTKGENSPAASSRYPRNKSDQKLSSTSTALNPKQMISREQRRITTYFAAVIDKIAQLVENKVKLQQLLNFLHLHCHTLNPEIPYIDQHILQSTSKVSEVIEHLVPEYVNYMETGLLEGIVERFECKEAQNLLQQYRDRYPNNRLLRDMPNPLLDKTLDQTRRKRLRIKCKGDFDSARAVDVLKIQVSVESATGIDRCFVTPAQHSEGCFILTILVHRSLNVIFHELGGEDIEFLAEAGIVELQIDDFVISDIQKYCPQRTRSSSQITSVPDAVEIGTTAEGFYSYMEQRVEHFTSKEKSQLKCLLESIPISKMEEISSGSYLQQLATHMTDWKKLAPHFGISEHEARKLTHKYPNVVEQGKRALKLWKQVNPQNATYKDLITRLLVHAPFNLAEVALKMLNPDAAVQETRKLLQAAYLSKQRQTLWTGAPELFQFDRMLGKITKDIDGPLNHIDYSSQFETLEYFSSEIKTVSIKSFVNSVALAKEQNRLFPIRGPPGSGKTELLRRLCVFWAKGFCLRKFVLLLWLDLNLYPSAPSDVSLKTVLSYSLPQGSDLDIIKEWLDRHGTQDILIVIDGVDGLACCNWKPFLDMLLERTELSVILIATGPIQIKNLPRSQHQTQHRDFQQYHLLGLCQYQISKQVISHYQHNPSRAEEFLMYISEAHDIRALCSSPPYLAAVLFVFDNVSTKELPNTWTQFFTSLTNSLLALSSPSDHNALTVLASEAYYAITNSNCTLYWRDRYSNFCSRVSSPYCSMVTAAEHFCFILPLLQQYLCAQHIHSLPPDQHVPTVTLHVRQFYIGLCSSSDKPYIILDYKNMFMYASCISEVSIKELQVLMSSQLTFKDQLLTSFDIDHIFQAVQYSGLQCNLEFHSCHFGSQTIEIMAKYLRAFSILPICGTVQELSLWNNKISDRGAHALAGALQVNRSLQKLGLRHNNISDEGACALAEALQVNNKLQELDLGRNQITDKFACSLARALQVNQSLQKLDLRRNKISAEGACALARALKVNCSLKKLDLKYNMIRDEGACALAEALQVNQSLQELDFWSNEITDKGAGALAGALQVNQSLQKLILKSNNISAQGARALAGALQVNQTLQELDLWYNKISDEGAHALAGALQVNQSLQRLNLWNNNISTEGASALAAALQVNPNLQGLQLYCHQLYTQASTARSIKGSSTREK